MAKMDEERYKIKYKIDLAVSTDNKLPDIVQKIPAPPQNQTTPQNKQPNSVSQTAQLTT